MSASRTEVFTAADYRAMPEDGKRYQLVEGELIAAPALNTFHQVVHQNIVHVLKSYLLGNPTGTMLYAACDVYLDELNVFQPDILYVTREHGTRIHDDGVHGAPDLVVEILSASTAGLDRRKRGLFAAAGTIEFWQIDPGLRQIQRFIFAENRTKPVALIDEPETFSSPLFPGLTIATADVFRR